jgi:hypothetical protein
VQEVTFELERGTKKCSVLHVFNVTCGSYLKAPPQRSRRNDRPNLVFFEPRGNIYVGHESVAYNEWVDSHRLTLTAMNVTVPLISANRTLLMSCMMSLSAETMTNEYYELSKRRVE